MGEEDYTSVPKTAAKDLERLLRSSDYSQREKIAQELLDLVNKLVPGKDDSIKQKIKKRVEALQLRNGKQSLRAAVFEIIGQKLKLSGRKQFLKVGAVSLQVRRDEEALKYVTRTGEGVARRYEVHDPEGFKTYVKKLLEAPADDKTSPIKKPLKVAADDKNSFSNIVSRALKETGRNVENSSEGYHRRALLKDSEVAKHIKTTGKGRGRRYEVLDVKALEKRVQELAKEIRPRGRPRKQHEQESSQEVSSEESFTDILQQELRRARLKQTTSSINYHRQKFETDTDLAKCLTDRGQGKRPRYAVTDAKSLKQRIRDLLKEARPGRTGRKPIPLEDRTSYSGIIMRVLSEAGVPERKLNSASVRFRQKYNDDQQISKYVQSLGEGTKTRYTVKYPTMLESRVRELVKNPPAETTSFTDIITKLLRESGVQPKKLASTATRIRMRYGQDPEVRNYVTITGKGRGRKYDVRDAAALEARLREMFEEHSPVRQPREEKNTSFYGMLKRIVVEEYRLDAGEAQPKTTMLAQQLKREGAVNKYVEMPSGSFRYIVKQPGRLETFLRKWIRANNPDNIHTAKVHEANGRVYSVRDVQKMTNLQLPQLRDYLQKPQYSKLLGKTVASKTDGGKTFGWAEENVKAFVRAVVADGK